MMKNFLKPFVCCTLLVTAILFSFNVQSQTQNQGPDAESVKKATEWVSTLHLQDAQKESRVSTTISTHLTAIRNWHQEHPANTVPEGINPVTGVKLSELDRQIIADSAIPATVHEQLMQGLTKELQPAQVEMILDKYTIGKVAFTLAGYKAIVTDLTAEEESKITGLLKQAREQAVDYKNMKQISAIFEIYKTKAEQYLNSNGRSWRALYSAYTNKIKAEKASKKQ
ncbi:DUF3826 domain-containing protein [Pedobacter sp.]|uniref:DUF3826 domain-containing protein n=1 Tax=Pedobacter sp. TaxID=1411316 RepID=UPI003D7FF179